MKIILLAVITFILAGLIIFFFPRSSIAPTPDTRTTTTDETPINPTAPIVLDDVSTGDQVVAGQTVSGTAPGPWFFEASFPVYLKDNNGNVFATTHAQTSADWMVTSMVAFTITLPVSFSYTGPGTIVMEKDNPSGEPANAASVSIPVVFQ